MRRPSWVSGSRTVLIVWLTVAVAGSAMVTVLATGSSQPALRFQQAGHWVLNSAAGALFHVNGGAKDVDARTAPLPDPSAQHAVAQGSDVVYAADSTGITGFGKSTLSQQQRIPTDFDEVPVPIEAVGGPYYVYQRSGTIVRMGPTAKPIRAGGPVANPVSTANGTVWFRRVDTGALCELGIGATQLRCPAVLPAGHRGALTTVGNQAMFVDVTTSSVRTVGDKGFGSPVVLNVRLPGDAQVSASGFDGTLPIVVPHRNDLLLASVGSIATGRLPSPLTVPLGAGDFAPPQASANAVVLVDRTTNRVLTFDATGHRRSVVPLPLNAEPVALSRGEDGRVYVDTRGGADTLVVDGNGSVATVRVDQDNVPSNRPPRRRPTQPPATQAPPAVRTRPNPPQPTKVKPTAPGAPGQVTTRAGNAAIDVSWHAASPNGAAVTSYQVSWRVTSGSGGNGGSATVPGRQLSRRVTGLTNGTTYVVTVRGVNVVGIGPGADSPPATPSSDVPGTPDGVRASAVSDGSVTVSWQAANGEGHRITGYTVAAAGSDGSKLTPATNVSGTSTSITSLTLGVTYTFTVTATNDVSLTGEASAPSAAVTPYQPADAPGALTASGSDGTVRLTWTAPQLNGGDFVDYVVSGPDIPAQTLTDSSTTSATIAGLNDGTAYQIQVIAVTRQHGTTGSTVDGTPATTTGTPGTAPTVTITSASLSGDRQIRVQFSADDHNSGPGTCQMILDGAGQWSGPCTSQAVTIGNLAYGHTYDIYVNASNAYGASNSNHASATTNAPPPPPPSVSVSKGAATSVTGCTSNCFQVVVTLQNFSPNASYTVSCFSSVDSGAYYTYTVRANGSGASTSAVCAFGFGGKQVWASAGGVTSAHVTW